MKFSLDGLGDQEALDLWKTFRQMSIDNLKQVYQVFVNLSLIVSSFDGLL